MALEDLTGAGKGINNLVPANPDGLDARSEGDNHIRGIKNVLVNTFGAMPAAGAVGTPIGAMLRWDGAKFVGVDFGKDAQLFLSTYYGTLKYSLLIAEPGWQLADGHVIAAGTFAGLFAWIAANPGARVTEAQWNAGQFGAFAYPGDNPANGLKIPSLMGTFIRSRNSGGAGSDAGRANGSFQGQQLLDHQHALLDPGHEHGFDRGNSGFAGSVQVTPASATVDTFGRTKFAGTNATVQSVTGAAAGADLRPVNIAWNPLIFVGS